VLAGRLRDGLFRPEPSMTSGALTGKLRMNSLAPSLVRPTRRSASAARPAASSLTQTTFPGLIRIRFTTAPVELAAAPADSAPLGPRVEPPLTRHRPMLVDAKQLLKRSPSQRIPELTHPGKAQLRPRLAIC